MRAMVLAAAALLMFPGAVAAQVAADAHYSTAKTEIGVLLDDPAAKAILDKHVPGMTSNDQVDMARAMTLKDIQQYASETITDQVLAAIDADFAKLPAKK